MSKTITRIIFSFLSLIIALTVGYAIYMLAREKSNTLITATVELACINDGINAEGVIVRDEELIYKKDGFYYSPIANTGDRISAGSSIAVFFASSINLSLYLQICELESKITLLESIAKSGASGIDLSECNGKIYSP